MVLFNPKMDKRYVKTAIEGLKSTSSSHVQESLVKIKNKIIIDDNGLKLFTECGGLNYLVPHLRKPNERILDLALSILGNCCLNDECRFTVGRLNTFAPLISVLKTVSRDSIVGRACRVVGNLAQKLSNAEEFHNHGAITALVTLIESRDKNTSYPTLCMAVRALRQLWMVINKREEMLILNSVQCISNLLIKECETAGILDDPQAHQRVELGKSLEELIRGILKSFGCFTTHATIQIAHQIQGTGKGHQCLISLTKQFEPLALRVIMNLCYVPTSRVIFGNLGLIPCLIQILRERAGVSYWPEGMGRTLSQLSIESVNRPRISHGGGLPLLMAAAKENSCALRGLLQYVMDDTGFQILVNEGLIYFLTEQLKEHVKAMDYEHDYIETKNKVTMEDVSEVAIPDISGSNKPQADKDCLFKRRKHLSGGNSNVELSVVIERDNSIVGFSEARATDTSDDSQAEDSSSTQESRRTLKRARSKSWNIFMKRARVWGSAGGSGVYWEVKGERDWPSPSRSSFSPEPGPMSPMSDAGSGFSPEYRTSRCRGRSDWSPESGFCTGDGSMASSYRSEYPWNPSSEGSPTSPFSVNDESSDSEISGRYSPVCSEHDADTEPTASDVNVATIVDLDAAQVALDELAMDDGNGPNDDEPLEESDQDLNTDCSRIACVLVLLLRVATGPNSDRLPQPIGVPENPRILSTLPLLNEEEHLNTLLDYVAKCRTPTGRAARILTLIFSGWSCMKSILKSKIILKVHSMSVNTKHPTSKCRQCRLIQKVCLKLINQIGTAAESSYGNGEITYQLLRGPESTKAIMALTLSFVVKSKEFIKKYYVDCYALKILFAGILDNMDDLEYYAVGLGKIATNAHIKNPKDLEKLFTEQIYIGYDPILDDLSNDEIVTFELDDSSTVRANKTFLCQNSEVFSAMLMGHFKESKDKLVKIKNVTKPGLEHLLTLLNCGLNGDCHDVRVFPMADKLETNLEVFLLADRFLLDKLKVMVRSAILQFSLTPDSADKIYVWSLNEGMGFLCVEAVAYLLTGKMCDTDRAQAFRNILNLEYREQWLDDMKSVILRQLKKKL